MRTSFYCSINMFCALLHNFLKMIYGKLFRLFSICPQKLENVRIEILSNALTTIVTIFLNLSLLTQHQLISVYKSSEHINSTHDIQHKHTHTSSISNRKLPFQHRISLYSSHSIRRSCVDQIVNLLSFKLIYSSHACMFYAYKYEYCIHLRQQQHQQPLSSLHYNKHCTQHHSSLILNAACENPFNGN